MPATPTLTVQGLVLRPLQESDGEFLNHLTGHEDVRFFGSFTSAREVWQLASRASARTRAGYQASWVIESEGVPVGVRELHVEKQKLLPREIQDRVAEYLDAHQAKDSLIPLALLSSAVLPGFRNRGYSSQSTQMVMEFAKQQLGTKLIFARTWPDNLASQRALIKAGLVPIKLHKSSAYFWFCSEDLNH